MKFAGHVKKVLMVKKSLALQIGGQKKKETKKQKEKIPFHFVSKSNNFHYLIPS